MFYEQQTLVLTVILNLPVLLLYLFKEYKSLFF